MKKLLIVLAILILATPTLVWANDYDPPEPPSLPPSTVTMVSGQNLISLPSYWHIYWADVQVEYHGQSDTLLNMVALGKVSGWTSWWNSATQRYVSENITSGGTWYAGMGYWLRSYDTVTILIPAP